MSSLPQGWHGVANTQRRSLPAKPAEFVSSVPTLRKKWNSSVAKDKSTTNLPTYRKSSMPALPNGFQSKITPPSCSSAKVSKTTLPKNQMPECSGRSAVRAKESHPEIASLRKELTTLKSENIVLKSKLRKLDDENAQKSRQISKLKAEMQNETLNQKKVKESESVVALRQKVQRLQSTLKEKDQSIKRMVTEFNSVKAEELKDIIAKYHKQFGITSNGLGSDFFQKHKLVQPNNEVPSAPAVKQSRTNIKDQTPRPLLDKYRNLLQKKETEIKNLQNQIKERDLEIRQLKIQLSRQSYRSGAITQSASSRLPSSTSVTKISPPRTAAPRVQSVTKVASASHINSGRKMPLPSSGKTSSGLKKPVTTTSSCSTFVINRATGVPKSTPKPLRMSSQDQQRDIMLRAQRMRENIAARKIQQGWRHHRMMMQQETATAADEEKAFSLISSEAIAHRRRREKLTSFQTQESTSQAYSKQEAKEIFEAFKSLRCGSKY